MGIIHNNNLDSYNIFNDEQHFQDYLDSVDKFIEAIEDEKKYMEYIEKHRI